MRSISEPEGLCRAAKGTKIQEFRLLGLLGFKDFQANCSAPQKRRLFASFNYVNDKVELYFSTSLSNRRYTLRNPVDVQYFSKHHQKSPVLESVSVVEVNIEF